MKGETCKCHNTEYCSACRCMIISGRKI